MTDTTLNVDELTARLAEIETERDGLLAQLRAAANSIGEVLGCYAAESQNAPKKKAKPAAKKKAAPKAKRPRAANVTDAELSAAVSCVAAGNVKDIDPRVLAAAKRRGLITCTGRGRGATYAVAAS